jgi:hypothetical protein
MVYTYERVFNILIRNAKSHRSLSSFNILFK